MRKKEPDIRLYVLALLALARQLQDKDIRDESPSTPADGKGGES